MQEVKECSLGQLTRGPRALSDGGLRGAHPNAKPRSTPRSKLVKAKLKRAARRCHELGSCP